MCICICICIYVYVYVYTCSSQQQPAVASNLRPAYGGFSYCGGFRDLCWGGRGGRPRRDMKSPRFDKELNENWSLKTPPSLARGVSLLRIDFTFFCCAKGDSSSFGNPPPRQGGVHYFGGFANQLLGLGCPLHCWSTAKEVNWNIQITQTGLKHSWMQGLINQSGHNNSRCKHMQQHMLEH